MPKPALTANFKEGEIMLRREIPTVLFVVVIVAALLIVAAIYWRKSGGGRGEIILEKAEKPFPIPPALQKQQKGIR